jgi:hypothetical protein
LHGYDELGNRTHTRMPDGRTLHWLFYGSGHLHHINIAAAQGPDQPPAAHQVIADMERDALHREVRLSQGALSSRYDSGTGQRAQHLLVPMRPDRAPLDHRRTGPRGLGHTTAYSWTTGRGISLWD